MLVISTYASWLIYKRLSTQKQEEKHKSLHQSCLNQCMLRLFQIQSLGYESTSFCFVLTCLFKWIPGTVLPSHSCRSDSTYCSVLLKSFIYYRYNVWLATKYKQEVVNVINVIQNLYYESAETISEKKEKKKDLSAWLHVCMFSLPTLLVIGFLLCISAHWVKEIRKDAIEQRKESK